MKEEPAAMEKSRIHLSLPTADLREGVRFYTALFGVGPSKERPGYARFEAAEPSVLLALVEAPEFTREGGDFHYGIQVRSWKAALDILKRLERSGYTARVERGIECCYSVQDKFWVKDPGGRPWEVYVRLTDEGESLSPRPAEGPILRA